MTEHPIIFSGPMVEAIQEGRKTQTRRVINPQPTAMLEWFPKNKRKKPIIASSDAVFAEAMREYCPYGKVGDRLWLKEKHAFVSDNNFKPGDTGVFFGEDRGIFSDYSSNGLFKTYYAATPPELIEWDGGWRSPIYMPRWASRLTLEITGVRVERVQDISEEDAISEGMVFTDHGKSCFHLESFQKYDQKICSVKKEFHDQLKGWSFKKTESHKHCLGTARFAFANLFNKINFKKFDWYDNPWIWVIEFKVLEGV